MNNGNSEILVHFNRFKYKVYDKLCRQMLLGKALENGKLSLATLRNNVISTNCVLL